MLLWIVIIAMCVVMYRIAETENQPGWRWALITFLICLACGVLIPLAVLNVAIGAILSFSPTSHTR
jgi:RsiW-degrading membrane proteinase PrsW (M82 family)